jgi:hypothetical protein
VVRLGAVVATLVMLSAEPVSAGEEPSVRGFVFGWTAPEECPNQSWALESVLGFLRRRTVTANVDVRVVIKRSSVQPPRFEAKITTLGMGPPGERAFEGASCESVAQAAALMIAMAIDPTDVAETVAPVVSRPPGTLLGVGLTASGDIGSLPAPTLGVGGSITVHHNRLTIEGAGTAWLPRVELKGPRSSSGGEIGLYTGNLRGCLDVFALASAGLNIGGCAAAELGVITGSGVDLRNPASSSGLWAAALVGIELRPIAGTLRPYVLLEGGVPFVRPTFEIDGFGAVFQPFPVFGRATVAVAWIFP